MRKRPVAGICCCLIFLICMARLAGMPAFWASGQGANPEEALSPGTKASVYGQIYRRERTDTGIVLYLKNTILVVHSNRYFLQNSRITYASVPEVKTGYSVCASGRIYFPEKARNPGQFDGEAYYSLRHISLLMQGESCEVTRADTAPVQNALDDLREAFSMSLERGVDGAQAGTLRAILLGEKNAMDGDVKLLYQQGGISHIIAVSGLHVSLLGMGLYRLLRRRFGIGFSAAASGGVLFLYLFMIGFSVSAQRAVYMFWLQMGARALGRRYDRPTAIALAACIILLQNPLYLFDCGFLLSFMAAGALFMLEGAGGALKTGIWLWICLLPLCAWFFYEITPASILLNLLVIPLLSLVLLSGLGGGIAGLFSVEAGKILLYPAGIILRLYTWCCAAAEKLPFGRIIVGRPAFWQVIAAYGLIAVFLLRRRKRGEAGQVQICEPERRLPGSRRRGKRQAASAQKGEGFRRVCREAAVWAFILLLVCIRFPENTQITMLDVGQGDCGVITARGAGAILVDGGSSSEEQVGRYRILPYLKYRGIRHISCIILTHPDEDHMNGLIELLEMKRAGTLGMAIDQILVPEWMQRGEAGEAFLTAAEGAGVPVRFVKKGDLLQNGELTLRFLHPDGEEYEEDTNAGSLTFLLSCSSFTELFTGDLQGAGEEAVLRQRPVCDVLKVSHHGSKNSTSAEWISQTSPSLALISCGENNRYGHPHAELLERLSRAGVDTFATKDYGALTIILKKDGSYVLQPWL